MGRSRLQDELHGESQDERRLCEAFLVCLSFRADRSSALPRIHKYWIRRSE